MVVQTISGEPPSACVTSTCGLDAVCVCDRCAPTPFVSVALASSVGSTSGGFPWQLVHVTDFCTVPSMCSVVAAAPDPEKMMFPVAFDVPEWHFVHHVPPV